MASDSGKRRLWGIGGLCLVIAVLGSVVLAGRTIAVALLWLGVWSVIGLAVGWSARRRELSEPQASGGGAESSSGLPEHHRCPHCDARLTLQRPRKGDQHGRPRWVCPQHGPI
jgi:hypothetical protein